MWPWFKKNPFIVALMGGTLVSYMFIKATAFVASYYDGLIWPGRFIGFAIGILSFALLTNYFMNEGVNAKTFISLILATAIIAIQLFWK
jgi:Kef-type K+ transport system membrane component KefB